MSLITHYKFLNYKISYTGFKITSGMRRVMINHIQSSKITARGSAGRPEVLFYGQKRAGYLQGGPSGRGQVVVDIGIRIAF